MSRSPRDRELQTLVHTAETVAPDLSVAVGPAAASVAVEGAPPMSRREHLTLGWIMICYTSFSQSGPGWVEDIKAQRPGSSPEQKHSLKVSGLLISAKLMPQGRHVEDCSRMLTSPNDIVARSSDVQDCGRGAYDGTAKKRRAERSSGDERDTSRNKRRRTAPSESDDSGTGGDEYHNNGGDDGGCGGPAADPEPLRQGMKCPICHNSNFSDTDCLLRHLVDAHLGNCCPICEERIVDLGGGRYGLKDGTIENIFFKDKLMKPHVLRVHLRPYKCLVPPCSKRFDSRGLKKHLGFGGKNPRSPHTKDDIEAAMKLANAPPGLRTWGDSGSNLGNPQLSALVSAFKGSKTKEQMKGYLYRCGKKLYDYDDPAGPVDRLSQCYGDSDFEYVRPCPPPRTAMRDSPEDPPLQQGAESTPSEAPKQAPARDPPNPSRRSAPPSYSSTSTSKSHKLRSNSLTPPPAAGRISVTNSVSVASILAPVAVARVSTEYRHSPPSAVVSGTPRTTGTVASEVGLHSPPESHFGVEDRDRMSAPNPPSTEHKPQRAVSISDDESEAVTSRPAARDPLPVSAPPAIPSLSDTVDDHSLSTRSGSPSPSEPSPYYGQGNAHHQREIPVYGGSDLQELAGHTLAQNMHQNSPKMFSGIVRYLKEQRIIECSPARPSSRDSASSEARKRRTSDDRSPSPSRSRSQLEPRGEPLGFARDSRSGPYKYRDWASQSVVAHSDPRS